MERGWAACDREDARWLVGGCGQGSGAGIIRWNLELEGTNLESSPQVLARKVGFLVHLLDSLSGFWE